MAAVDRLQFARECYRAHETGDGQMLEVYVGWNLG
jgi:hypothetical protein